MLAELFDKDDETIRCWIRKGVFPSAFKVEDGWYVPSGDLKKLMKVAENGVEKTASARRATKGFVREW